MTSWRLLLVTAAFAACVSLGSAAPRQGGLTYDNHVIKDADGKVIARVATDISTRERSLSKSCKTTSDGPEVIDCQTWQSGRSLRVVRDSEFCLTLTSGFSSSSMGLSFTDDFPLHDFNWYGGGEEIPQKWPLETYTNLSHSMVTQQEGNRGIQEAFWFNSDGVLIYVWPGAPLFVNLNTPTSEGLLRLISKVEPPYRKRAGGFEHTYTTCKMSNAKEAFQTAIKNYIKHPSGYPDERMIRYPLYSTWARYKAAIDETIVREYARQINEYGFKNSQLEIDDAWETCYGSKVVDTTRFPDMKKLTDDLKKDGFRVTIWTHPFVNINCTEALDRAKAADVLAKDESGNIKTTWWNSVENDATIIDFSKDKARKWFIKEHEDMMQKTGVDGFKFDAGETSWFPQLPDLSIPKSTTEDYPNLVTKQYIETCNTFNSLSEVRSAYRTQTLPLFVRMVDKDSRWGDDNGLLSLVTTLLQMNMVGYSMVLPDMIGGNQYDPLQPVTPELFIRWLQANTFMPALQYSLVPWDFKDHVNQTVEISKKFNDMHADYTDIIIKAMKKNVQDGSPVNPPIWWLDPTDKLALKENTEFLLGEEVLAAPVLVKGAVTRDVYLPIGSWRDGNTMEVHTGPKTIKDYPAPLEVLPFFVIVDSDADKVLNPSSTPSPAASAVASLSVIVLSVIAALHW